MKRILQFLLVGFISGTIQAQTLQSVTDAGHSTTNSIQVPKILKKGSVFSIGDINTGSSSNTNIYGHRNTVNTSDATIVGYQSNVTGTSASVFGKNNTVGGHASLAYGNGNYIYSGGHFSSAFGDYNYVAGWHAYAVGTKNSLTGSYAYAFGRDNNVSGYASYAFGKNITNNVPYSVMIGPSDASKMTILNNGYVGIGTTNPLTKLNVVGQGLFSRDNWSECCSGNDYTLALAEYTINTGKKASISFHNAGIDEGEIELSHDAGFRSIKFYDHQNLGLGIDVRGNGAFSGKVAIGTVDFTRLNDYGLAVNGTIVAKKIKVTQNSPWPDYVFKSSYKLLPLSSLETFINTYNHLPDVPSATEVEENGIDIAFTQAALLKKIEELTLYVIEQGKQLKKQAGEIKKLKQR